MSRVVTVRTYKVRYGFKRDVSDADGFLGNGVWAVRLWVEGILQVRASSKAGAKREGLYFLKTEFPRSGEIKVFSVERRKRGGR